MKNINSQQKQGLEPVNVIGIKWDGSGEYFYADKNLNGINGKILQLSQVQETITEDGAGSASSLNLKLEDSDGKIKLFFDTLDLYLKPVALYQSFEGSASNLRIPIYNGVIVGPINWDEGTRSIDFAITTRKINNLVGFSYDETNVPVLHQTLIGKEWPMPFGTPVNYPALALQDIPTGTITIGFGVPDPTIPYQLSKVSQSVDEAMEEFMKKRDLLFSTGGANRTRFQDMFNTYWMNIYTQELRAAEAAASSTPHPEVDALRRSYAEQARWFKSSNSVIGGYKFPQNVPLVCKINEDLFIVTFLGDGHLPSNPNESCPVHLEPYFLPDPSSTLAAAGQNKGPGSHIILEYLNNKKKDSTKNNPLYNRRKSKTDPLPRDYPVYKSGFTWISPGSSISLIDDFEFSYLASMIPGVVLNVYAYKSYNGLRKLTQVPSNYYTVSYQGPLTVVSLKRPLSIISYLINQQQAQAEEYLSAVGSEYNSFVPDHIVSTTDWEDQIYVTFYSTVGPNICDIITWLISNYTNYKVDPISFAHVHELVANYPANFVVPGRPLVDELISDIAYQSRCSLILRENTYFISYLPEIPTPVTTITPDDIVEESLKISTNPIENLVTRYRGTWRPDYSPDYESANLVIVQANHIKYGYLDFEKDFFIFNQYYLVNKAVLFWMIRKCQIYKQVTCELFLTKLGLEVQDTVLLSLRGFLANEDVLATVIDTSFNTDSNTVSVTFWTPVLIGTMVSDRFAYPKDLAETDFFAPVQPITGGGSVSYNPGNIPKPASDPNGPGVSYAPSQQSVDWEGNPEFFGDSYWKDSNGWIGTPLEYQPNESLTPINGTAPPSDNADPKNDSNQTNTYVPGYEGFDATTPPSFDSGFALPKIEKPTQDTGIPSDTQAAGTTSFIGKVFTGTGNQYAVTLYPMGTDGPPGDTVQVKIPTIDPTETIPENTWLNPINRYDVLDENGVVIGVYYECQVPIWLDTTSGIPPIEEV